MIITCSKCGRQLSINDASITPGAKVKCPSCETINDITPAAPKPQAPAAAAANDSPIGLAPEEDITPPSTMPGLSPAPRATPRATPRFNAGSFTISSNHVALAKLLVIAGLMLVVLARGFTSVTFKNMPRRAAAYDKAEYRYNEDRDSGNERFSQTERGERLDESRQNANFAMGIQPYWHEWLFIIGSLILVYGLLIVGFGGDGPEKIVALAMLAIITFSIYVIGAPWVSALVGGLSG
jgi:predicted Zn finger-like uncharacterized protein